jgi:hypothetical protein
VSDKTEKNLREFFGLDGGEFMNTGLTLAEWCATRDLEKIANSFVQQSRTEQKRRLHYVLRLAVEGARIREINNFGSVVVERAVEHVMEGAWEEVRHDVSWCLFEGALAPEEPEKRAKMDPEDLAWKLDHERELRDLWAPFRRLLEEAYAGRVELGQSTTRH